MSQENRISPDNWAQRHRQLRLFISSTFIDMNAERNALTRIFPQIRELCNKRDVEFVPLDLRWGITEEAAKEGRVVETCLREIDDSRPFFIGVVGDRYGWAPSENELGVFSHDLLHKYPWLTEAINNKTSITEMEMQHAVLMRNDNDHMNAAFYIRSEKMVVPSNFKEIPGSNEEKKLLQLKSEIRNQKQFPVRDYDSADELAESVLKDIIEFLDRAFPEFDVESYDKETDRQERLLRSRSQSLISLARYQQQINNWIEGKSKRDLAITGSVGVGKSYLLADVIARLRKKGNKLVYVDISEHENLVTAAEYITGELLCQIGVKSRKRLERGRMTGCLFSFVWMLIKIFFVSLTTPFRLAFGNQDNEQKNLKEKVGGYVRSFDLNILESNFKLLYQTLQKHSDTTLYVALDNMDDVAGKDLSIFEFFGKLPQIRLLTSMSSGTNAHAHLQNSRTTELLQVHNMTINQVAGYVNRYLALYGKSLDSKGEQCGKLLRCGVAGNPLLLSHVLELMVRFGSHEQLDSYVNELSAIKNESALYELLLKQILAQFKSGSELDAVKEIITAFAVVKRGLSESEIKDVFNPKPLEWALLRPYIFSICKCKGNLWKPASPRCRTVILETMKEYVSPVVDKIARHYEDMLHCSSYHKDALGVDDGMKYMNDSELLFKQVQVLPELYYENDRVVELYYWSAYLRADVYFTGEQRMRYWRKLYKEGHCMRAIYDVDIPPYVHSKLSGMFFHNNYDELLHTYKWLKSSKDELYSLYNRWIETAAAYGNADDIQWLSENLKKSSDQKIVDFTQLNTVYQGLMARKEWDKIIAKAENEIVNESYRLSIDLYVTIAYNEKGDTQAAFDLARKNVNRMIDMHAEEMPETLIVSCLFAKSACKHGEMQDVNLALKLLKLHENKNHTIGLDSNNSYVFYESLALVYLKKGNYNAAISSAQIMAKVLSNMGVSTNAADKIISLAKKAQDKNS